MGARRSSARCTPWPAGWGLWAAPSSPCSPRSSDRGRPRPGRGTMCPDAASEIMICPRAAYPEPLHGLLLAMLRQQLQEDGRALASSCVFGWAVGTAPSLCHSPRLGLARQSPARAPRMIGRCVCVRAQCTYKKKEVNRLSTGTPKISFDFLRGVLPHVQPTRPCGRLPCWAPRTLRSSGEPLGYR